MSRDVHTLLERETQLNLISYLTILALVALSGLLLYMLVAHVPVPDFWILGDTWVRAIGVALVFAIVIYLADQQRRLQLKLSRSYSALAAARSEISSAYERLVFAHHAAEVMTSLPHAEALDEILDDIAGHFEAHASAVVGQDVTMFVRDPRYHDDASAAVMQAALDTVRAGRPLSVLTSDDGSTALAVPLRVEGRLHSVLCIWRRKGDLPQHHLDGLQLVARILELSIENRSLLEETGDQLGGMTHALLDLLERRSPAYTEHAELVAHLAEGIAAPLGIAAERLNSLRLAALLHDIGMLEVPEQILAPSHDLSPNDRATIERHPLLGAELAEVAGLKPEVVTAIRSHHERLDGSGYPTGARDERISLLARILAVADDFATMTAPRAGGSSLPVAHALHVLHLGAGTQYDPRIVASLEKFVGQPCPLPDSVARDSGLVLATK